MQTSIFIACCHIFHVLELPGLINKLMTTEILGGRNGLTEAPRKTLTDLAVPLSETVVHDRGVTKEMVEQALSGGVENTVNEKCARLASVMMDILSFDGDKRTSLGFDKQAVCDWLNQYAKSLVAGTVFERRGEVIVRAPELKAALIKLSPDEVKKIEEATEIIFPK